MTEERTRIARELHNITAHGMSVMAVQADAARGGVTADDHETRAALVAIERTGRESLREMRRLLGLLRDDGPGSAALAPQPGPADLPELVRSVRRAGVPVELSVEGEPVALAPGVDLAASRIVQEALTNVMRHAGTVRAIVRLGYEHRDLLVQVIDTGRSTAGSGGGTGHGIHGMRERARVYGGSLEAGCDSEGFAVPHGCRWIRRCERPRAAAAGSGAVSVRVLLVDDQPLVREGFRRVLPPVDLEVLGEAADGHQAVDAARRLTPDVVIMNVRMPILDGLEATERILAADACVRILVLTTFRVDEYVFRALQAGASGFLLEDTPLDELVAGIRLVARGDGLLAPAVTRRVTEEFARRPGLTRERALDGRLCELTVRERDVLQAAARGQTNAEIGAGLHLSPAMVKIHVRSVLSKLGLRGLTPLAICAYESGFVRAGDR